MKRLICLVSFIALTCFPLLAQTSQVKALWDPNPSSENVQKYILYEKIGSSYSKIAEWNAASACKPTVCEGVISPAPSPGVHTYVITAANIWGESPYSTEVSTPSASGAPVNIRIEIIIVIR